MNTCLTIPLSLGLLTPLASAQQVWTVDASGAGDFLDIPTAVTAASQQDTLIVRAGIYSGFLIRDKALALVAEEGATPRVTGMVYASELPAGDEVSFSGLRFEGGIELSDCLGTVLFQDCVMRMPGRSTFVSSTYTEPPCFHTATGCADVVLENTVIRGRNGDSISTDLAIDGAFGETAFRATSSSVALYDSLLIGGDGGWSADLDVGFGICYPGYLGHGGHGLRLFTESLAFLDRTELRGGAGGPHDSCDGPSSAADGQPLALDGSSTADLADEPVLVIDGPAIAREGESMRLEVEGPPGAGVWWIRALAGDQRFLGTHLGILHLRPALQLAVLGTIPPDGRLEVDVPAPALPDGMQADRIWYQPFATHEGSRLLGNVRVVSLLDSAL